ncbi:immunity 49 family protein [Myxococcus sp. RHSTA-1-4]|uniref:immunity 49 family protein n=1 Tax=Myxococcus sp. RHSTA-1-4 TaxID=2874601 RepID=UPI001CC13222|nr:immunity 49 family protein [Myxococcus sp. RHSTA-1-4]MBZ4420561.1 immunity 49 family protein [Myxococcus sp. RHSTA-1-4]
MEIDYTLLREDAGAAVRALIAHIGRGDGDREALLSNTRELCGSFVTIAAATLLLEGRTQPFFMNLCRSAENWRRLLIHLEQRGLTPAPASWGLTPLAGAVVACHWELAAEVAARLTALRQEGEEYAVEFAWVHALGALVLHDVRGQDPAPWLELLERDAREECWPALAWALVRADSSAFTAAFDTAISEHTTRTEKLARAFTTRVDRFAAHRHLWFEGLALLRMARRRGLAVPNGGYRYCPPLALAPVTELYQGDWVLSLSPC